MYLKMTMLCHFKVMADRHTDNINTIVSQPLRVSTNNLLTRHCETRHSQLATHLTRHCATQTLYNTIPVKLALMRCYSCIINLCVHDDVKLYNTRPYVTFGESIYRSDGHWFLFGLRVVYVVSLWLPWWSRGEGREWVGRHLTTASVKLRVSSAVLVEIDV